MDSATMIAVASIIISGFTLAVGSYGPSVGEGNAVVQALASMAQQPDESRNLSRTLFVGLAMIESVAIYCFVLAMILLFANPFWQHFTRAGGL